MIIESDEGLLRQGFLVTCFVEAETEAEAKETALGIIRDDPKIKLSLRNLPGDPPEIFVDEIEELRKFPEGQPPKSGYAFYPEDESEMH